MELELGLVGLGVVMVDGAVVGGLDLVCWGVCVVEV